MPIRMVTLDKKQGQTEVKLSRDGDFSAAVLDTIGALVVVLDREGRILRFNRACERTTGYSSQEVKGKPFWDLFLIPEEVEPVKAVFQELRSGQFPMEHENFWLTKTRLSPPLSSAEAAELYRCFLLDKLAHVRSVKTAEPAVAYWPPGGRDFFADLAPGFHLISREGEDLSERLVSVFHGAFK